MSMGKGAIVNVLRRHKLNVGSSTESELVSIADALGVMIWCKSTSWKRKVTRLTMTFCIRITSPPYCWPRMGAHLQARRVDIHIHHRFFLIADKIEKGDVSVEHRGTEEMWADGDTKSLQGAGFRLFRPKIMGIPEDYDDEAERVRTRPLLLPKPKEAGMVPSADLQVLAKTLGVKGQDHGRQEGSTPPMTPAPSGRRSVLYNDKFGPGNRPIWDMKEGRVSSRYPDLIKALRRESDPSRRRLILAGHKTRIFGPSRGTVPTGVISQ